MRACEGCRRRKIKCDAATTNTWPCSACIRLKLQCVRPNGWDGSDSQVYETTSTSPSGQPQPAFEVALVQPRFHQHQGPLPLAPQPGKPADPSSLYVSQTSYSDAAGLSSQVGYADPTASLQYAAVTPGMAVVDPTYSAQNVFPTPSLHSSHADSPESYSTDQYGQGDLADLLGSLKVDEAGTGE